MTNTNSTVSSTVSFFESKDQATTQYLELAATRQALEAQLAAHLQVMSDHCKAMVEQFAAKDEKTGEYESLAIDLRDGNPRGSVIACRDGLYFVRGRSPGRPKKVVAPSVAVSSEPVACAPVPAAVEAPVPEAASVETEEGPLVEVEYDVGADETEDFSLAAAE